MECMGWPQESRLGRQTGEPGGHGEFMTLVFSRGCGRNCGPEPDTERDTTTEFLHIFLARPGTEFFGFPGESQQSTAFQIPSNFLFQ